MLMEKIFSSRLSKAISLWAIIMGRVSCRWNMTLAFLSSLIQPFKCLSIIKLESIIVFAAVVHNVQTLTTVTSFLCGRDINHANRRNVKYGDVFF